ncbi:hypothetical protein TNCV_3956591 [Trichonephila clavipes]|nr:hypothetical protein TNCV_3956591 [Trichonephila clavipes]
MNNTHKPTLLAIKIAPPRKNDLMLKPHESKKRKHFVRSELAQNIMLHASNDKKGLPASVGIRKRQERFLSRVWIIVLGLRPSTD